MCFSGTYHKLRKHSNAVCTLHVKKKRMENISLKELRKCISTNALEKGQDLNGRGLSIVPKLLLT